MYIFFGKESSTFNWTDNHFTLNFIWTLHKISWWVVPQTKRLWCVQWTDMLKKHVSMCPPRVHNILRHSQGMCHPNRTKMWWHQQKWDRRRWQHHRWARKLGNDLHWKCRVQKITDTSLVPVQRWLCCQRSWNRVPRNFKIWFTNKFFFKDKQKLELLKKSFLSLSGEFCDEDEDQCDKSTGTMCINGNCQCPFSDQYFDQHEGVCKSFAGGNCSVPKMSPCVPNAECTSAHVRMGYMTEKGVKKIHTKTVTQCLCKHGYSQTSNGYCFGAFETSCSSKLPCKILFNYPNPHKVFQMNMEHMMKVIMKQIDQYLGYQFKN